MRIAPVRGGLVGVPGSASLPLIARSSSIGPHSRPHVRLHRSHLPAHVSQSSTTLCRTGRDQGVRVVVGSKDSDEP
ncbi:hypothetical protein PENSPDRAFT_647309 [Peniophora sp. CONT]|nr:hypothetical protein PENSPDRAFT_647309 [Peniophora sp. CONT]